MAWVFDGGSELALAWHLFPMIEMATIHAGAYYDGKLVVLCNLGGSSEVLRPSHAYVLSVEDGRILKSVRGPSGLDYPRALITERYAYFQQSSRWRAFDLSEGKLASTPPLPPPRGLPLAQKYERIEAHRDENTGERLWRYRLGTRYGLTVAGKPGHKLSFDLSWDDSQGDHKTHLCRLPYRIRPGGRNLLFLADGGRLVFSWSWYLICVDTTKITDPSLGR